MLMMATALLTIPRMMNKLVFVLSKQSTYVGRPPYPFSCAPLFHIHPPHACPLGTLLQRNACLRTCLRVRVRHTTPVPRLNLPLRVLDQANFSPPTHTLPCACAGMFGNGSGRVRLRSTLLCAGHWAGPLQVRATNCVPTGYLWGTHGVLLPESPTAIALFPSLGLAHSCVTLPPRTPTSPTPFPSHCFPP
jgi:hypothetical protein